MDRNPRAQLAIQLPGPGKRRDQIEDRYAMSADARTVVVCDGASASYDARGWAGLLAQEILAAGPYRGDRYARAQQLSAAITQAQQRSRRARKGSAPREGAWYAAPAHRGADYATLTIVQSRPTAVEALVIGDSSFLMGGDNLWVAVPDPRSYDFTMDPVLISSVDPPDLAALAGGWHRFSLEGFGRRPTVLVATDALVPWITAAFAPGAPQSPAAALRTLIHQARVNHRVPADCLADDLTMVVMR